MRFPNPNVSTTPRELVEVIPVETRPDSALARSIPPFYRSRLFVDVIHDGDWVPEEFMSDGDGQPIRVQEFDAAYIRERDWGAAQVATRLVSTLGLKSFARVNVARVLMDFGRFPGSTPRNADHLHRFAINYPFSKRLSYWQKKRLLENYYDAVSDQMEQLLEGKLIKIAIHTYDQYNESGTERPPVSLMTRSIGYQTDAEMPSGLFDPLYPDILGEFTADRVLRDRISLTLEKAAIPVAHNYPYCLPEGSLEVRYQVWAYFRYLRRRFELLHPDTREDPVYSQVWQMLLDTNLRSTDSEALRSYLHMFRRAPAGRQHEFVLAEQSYEAIVKFATENHQEVIERYRFSPERPSSLALEVRKDIACELDDEGRAVRVRPEHLNAIADTIAEAIARYLREDRDSQGQPSGEFERHQPWYYKPRE